VRRESYDALLVLGFGGPESREEVLPFLARVTEGRNVPAERLVEVAEHYYALGGRSPINEQNRALVAALKRSLAERKIDLPIHLANRHAAPFVSDVLRELTDAGATRVLAIVTAAFSSFSGCRQYLDAIEVARGKVGEGAPVVDKARAFFNHPLFLDAVADRVSDALHEIDESEGKARLVFTAHSIPMAMANTSDYVAQLEDACSLVADRLGRSEWQLVFQSRSGPAHVPWLEPDIEAHLRALAQIGKRRVVVCPIGFLSDHVEVLWDLDQQAGGLAESLGIEMVRARTVGTHPKFVAALAEIVEERLGLREVKRAEGAFPPLPDRCPEGCCRYAPTISPSQRSAPPAD
jgi:protoporphyrin/coproporphyrin ferrochelatase